MKNDIIEKFIKETPAWLKSLKEIEKMSGKDCCPMCGARYETFKKLLEALKEIIKFYRDNN